MCKRRHCAGLVKINKLNHKFGIILNNNRRKTVLGGDELLGCDRERRAAAAAHAIAMKPPLALL
jgi:hypothetical protein